MNDSRLRVVVDANDYQKKWVKVFVWGKTKWIPSFQDLYRIISAICFCEDEKYPNGEGRGMVVRFLMDCCNPAMSWEVIKAKYQLPDREKKS